MNLLIITPLYPPALGGAATYFKQLVPCLVKHDEITQLTVLTERMLDQPRMQSDGKLGILRQLPNRISSGQKSFMLHAATYILTQMWFSLGLQALVRRYAIDVIHFHTRYRGRLFYNTLRRIQIPVIADLRDKMTAPLELRDMVSRLLCCGEGIYNFAVKSGFPPERIALIPNIFAPPECPTAAAVANVQKNYGLVNTHYMLYVGDMTFSKGVYELLAAYRIWRAQHPQISLVLVGTNREGKNFARQIDQTLGAIYLGHLPHQDILTLMHGAGVVVLPSRSEGLPTVILEAVAMGTKVICPPAVPEFERHLAEFVLPEVSVSAILETLDKVWVCSRRPTYPFGDHDVEKMGKELVSLYISVCHSCCNVI